RGMRDAERGAFDPASSSSSAFRVPRSAFRVGWGKGKFVAWVAATRAKPGGALIVPPGEEGKFLAAQPVAVLPLDPDAHRRLRQLGLRTLGQLAPLPEEAVVSQCAGAVERLVVEFTAFAPGTAELQLFARDAGAAARAGQRRALRSAVQEITLRLKRPMLHHVIEVQPWSRLPERRYALIDYEP